MALPCLIIPVHSYIPSVLRRYQNCLCLTLLRKKEHKSYFGKNRTHHFRTSRCAGYLLDHSDDEGCLHLILYTGSNITTVMYSLETAIAQIFAPFPPDEPPTYCTVYHHLVKSGGTSIKDQLRRESVVNKLPRPGMLCPLFLFLCSSGYVFCRICVHSKQYTALSRYGGMVGIFHETFVFVCISLFTITADGR